MHPSDEVQVTLDRKVAHDFAHGRYEPFRRAKEKLKQALRGALAQQGGSGEQVACRNWIESKNNCCFKPARYIVWGKLNPPEKLGPRCEDCFHDQNPEIRLSQIDQYSIYVLPAQQEGGVEEGRPPAHEVWRCLWSTLGALDAIAESLPEGQAGAELRGLQEHGLPEILPFAERAMKAGGVEPDQAEADKSFARGYQTTVLLRRETATGEIDQEAWKQDPVEFLAEARDQPTTPLPVPAEQEGLPAQTKPGGGLTKFGLFVSSLRWAVGFIDKRHKFGDDRPVNGGDEEHDWLEHAAALDLLKDAAAPTQQEQPRCAEGVTIHGGDDLSPEEAQGVEALMREAVEKVSAEDQSRCGGSGKLPNHRGEPSQIPCPGCIDCKPEPAEATK